MKKAWLLVLLLIPALATSQSGITLPAGSNTLKSIHLQGYPGVGVYSPSAGALYFGNETYGMTCTANGTCTVTGTTLTSPTITGATLTGATLTSPTVTTPTITSPTVTGTSTLPQLAFTMTADAVVNYGNTVMPDASAAQRFDVNTGNATGAIGVLTGTGASAQASSYSIVYGGQARVAIAEDQSATLGEYLVQSATAGVCNATTIGTIGLNIGRVLETAPVTNTINNAGCTGGAGCINTALDTPNAGPAGQITLAADVAAQGWAVGDPVQYWNSGGTSVAGLTDGKTYFLLSVDAANVTIAASVGGAVIVPTTQGDDATQYLIKLPLSVIHVY